jgi:hypothetical protein
MKGLSSGYRKGEGSRLYGAIKGAAKIAENPLVQFGVGMAAPELYPTLALAKESGLLKKIASS